MGWEIGYRRSADASRGAVLGLQFRVLPLDFLELAEELVVFPVAQDWAVEDVILVGSPVKRFPQLRCS